MYVLCSKIEIKSKKTWLFDKIVSVEVVRDTESLTDTCVVELPRKVKWQGESTIPIGRGDEITVWLGYDGNLQLAFRGFITAVGTKNPVRIECEDEMFKLKQIEAKKKAYKSVNLETLLKEQGLGYPLRVMGNRTSASTASRRTPWHRFSTTCRKTASARSSATRTAAPCFTAVFCSIGTAARRRFSPRG